VRNLRKLSNTARLPRSRADDGGEVVVEQDDVGCFLRDIVPERPIAMPTSAHLSAGASFTPSPVTATISPLCCRACTMRIFWSAAVRAKISPGSSSSSCRSVSDMRRSRSPVTATGSCRRPISRASALAVSGDRR